MSAQCAFLEWTQRRCPLLRRPWIGSECQHVRRNSGACSASINIIVYTCGAIRYANAPDVLHRPIMRMRRRSRAVAPVKIVFIELGRAGAQVLQRQLDRKA